MLALAAMSALACTDEERTVRVLREDGYTHIVTKGYAWTGCGEGDTYKTEFKAITPTGAVVSGVVCCGLWKGCTVRRF